MFDDPALKADVLAMLDHCKDAVLGKRQVLDAEGTSPPPIPSTAAFRLRLVHLNVLAGERLQGNARMQAWEALAQADAIGNPLELPPELIADLAAIESLGSYPQAAE